MALTLRPTGLESPVYNDLKDYTVFSGRWGIGRIYEERGARPEEKQGLAAPRRLD
jgi:hypothetical protein